MERIKIMKGFKQNLLIVNFLLIFFQLTISFNARSQTLYDSLWNDPAMQKKINDGIRDNRSSNFSVIVQTKDGKKVSDAKVNIRMTKHAFLFGANIFMLNGFDTPEKNRRYENVFTHLFNAATIPFYWKTLEPTPGQLRFKKNSVPVFRRPPPDAALEFCQQNNITPKGHLLVWDSKEYFTPDWWPKDTLEQEKLLDQRIQQIADRYKSSIKLWEVVNEISIRRMETPMPKDYALTAFKSAQKYFLQDDVLMINEATKNSWGNYKGEYSPYYLLIQNLFLRGAKIDAIGMQCHFFPEKLWQDAINGTAFTPKQIFDVLNRYSDFEKPIHITEITVPTLPATSGGEELQAKVVKNLYRLWFSHPSVEAMTWWNYVDGTAIKSEDKWKGGLLREDMSEKPSYKVLDELINKEWKTEVKGATDKNGQISFRAFFGEYEITVQHKNKKVVTHFQLLKNSKPDFIITIE